MKEYTLLALLSVFISVFLDYKSGTKLLKRKEYYIFLLVIFFFFFLVNGYLTGYVVIYNPEFFLGLRVGTIPMEDFFFNFSLITMTLIFWEFFKGGQKEG